jgi:BMFP domain-containing protein YqiC|tara:strand:- start:854 stop:1081 length:228 start_codon:yes stop_codon:yes gene_type:complete
MDNSQKILKMISGFIEAGIITTQDLKKELSTSLKFQKENFVGKLDLVTKKEFDVLKKIIEKQQKEINRLKKKRSK